MLNQDDTDTQTHRTLAPHLLLKPNFYAQSAHSTSNRFPGLSSERRSYMCGGVIGFMAHLAVFHITQEKELQGTDANKVCICYWKRLFI